MTRGAEPSHREVLGRLAALLGALPPAERRVAQVIVDDPGGAAGLTITELASAGATSEATVVRLCRNLGMAGYPALRLAIAGAAAVAETAGAPELSAEISREDSLAEVVAKVGDRDARAASETVANLDLDELQRAIVAVCDARRIDVYGVGTSGIVALDLQHKLHRIGLAVVAWSDPHLALPSAANLTARDVAVAISHSGTTIDTVDALARARQSGATTIVITNDPRSPIARGAAIVLQTTARETALRSGAMASRIAELTLVDCLFIGVAQHRYEETLAALARTHESVRRRHSGRRR